MLHIINIPTNTPRGLFTTKCRDTSRVSDTPIHMHFIVCVRVCVCWCVRVFVCVGVCVCVCWCVRVLGPAWSCCTKPLRDEVGEAECVEDTALSQTNDVVFCGSC